jgi:regulator of nonsense transcripts 2
LKKSTAFVKKLRVVAPDGLLGCIRDTDAINLTLYISEIVKALLETNFKATDVAVIVRLCGCLHRRYEEFTAPLVTGIKESLLGPDNSSDKEEIKKKRIQLRLAMDLFEVGVFTEEEFMIRLLRRITCKTKGAQAPSNQVLDLVGLVSFVKYGAETLFGYIPKKVLSICKDANKEPSEVALKVVASSSCQAEMKIILSEVYEQLCKDVIEAHKDLVGKEQRFEKDKVLHGSLSEAKQAELEGTKRLFEKLMSAVTSISECSGDPLPRLLIEKAASDSSKGISVWEGGAAASGEGGLYDDPETRSFYEDLPDLLSMVPLTALGILYICGFAYSVILLVNNRRTHPRPSRSYSGVLERAGRAFVSRGGRYRH